MYLYREKAEVVHLEGGPNKSTLCGVNRGSNRLKPKAFKRSPNWRALPGKRRRLCLLCKARREKS